MKGWVPNCTLYSVPFAEGQSRNIVCCGDTTIVFVAVGVFFEDAEVVAEACEDDEEPEFCAPGEGVEGSGVMFFRDANAPPTPPPIAPNITIIAMTRIMKNVFLFRPQIVPFFPRSGSVYRLCGYV